MIAIVDYLQNVTKSFYYSLHLAIKQREGVYFSSKI